jgi:hypothetical protein
MNDTLEHITILFAETAYTEFVQKRYGIKRCFSRVDLDLAQDLMNIYKAQLELQECSLTIGDSCTIESIEERINTL